MSEPGPVLSPDRPPEPVVYRPLSGLAIASLVVAASYAAVILILVVVAFWSHTPLFLATWTFLVPVAAVSLAVAARQQIQRSEGTRSGTALATWALWLGLLPGLGYGAFYFGTYVAVVRLQAQRFTNDWFDKLQNGQVEQAFLLTRPPDERAGNNDTERIRMRFGSGSGPVQGELARFLGHELIQVVRRGGPETSVTPLGVKSWEYTEGGYQVVQAYRITSPEGTFEADLTVRSSQGREFKGRQWHLVWTGAVNFGPRELTPRGMAMQEWPQAAAGFARQWLGRREPEQWHAYRDRAYLETHPRRERLRLRQQERLCLAVAGFTAAPAGGSGPGAALARVVPAVDPDLGQELYLPGYREFLAGGLIHSDPQTFRAPKPELKQAIPEAARRAYRDAQALMIRPKRMAVPRLVVPEGTKDRLQVVMDVEMRIVDQDPNGQPVPKYLSEGTLLLESDRGPITTERQPTWHVVRLDLVQGRSIDGAEDQGAPPPP